MRASFLTGCRIGAFGGLLMAAPISALAEDYPYSGHFWLSVGSPASTEIDRLCALSFLEQRTDGTWTVYHADMEAFATSAALIYRKVAEGECTFTPETKVESCVATEDKSFPEGEGQVVYDVVTTVSANRIDTVMIDAASGWETVTQDPTNPDAGYILTYLRCPFPEDTLQSLISDEPTTASPEELTELRFPSEDLVASPEVSALVAALHALN